MDEHEVKVLFSVEVLGKMRDGSAAKVLREVLFSSGNTIDWGKAYESLTRHMPELSKDR